MVTNKLYNSGRKNLLLIGVAAILFSISCQQITVPEICSSMVTLPNEFITTTEILHLTKHNNTEYNELDTMYLKVEKATGNKFKLQDYAEYEKYSKEQEYTVEQYIYLKGSNQTDIAWVSSMIQYQINKTLYPAKVICIKHLNNASMKTIQIALKESGFLENIIENPDYKMDIEPALLKFQIENNLAYGRLDLKSLRELGISVKCNSKLKDKELQIEKD